MHHRTSDGESVFEELLGVLPQRAKFSQAAFSVKDVLIELRGQLREINSRGRCGGHDSRIHDFFETRRGLQIRSVES